MRWAMAGRNLSKLVAVRALVAGRKMDPQVRRWIDLEYIQAP